MADRKELEPAYIRALSKLAFKLHAIRGLSGPFKKSQARTLADYQRYGVPKPPGLTPERLTDGFVDAVDQRHYSPAQLKAIADRLAGGGAAPAGLQAKYNYTASRIIILTRFREAVRQVALNQVFGTPQRRDEFYMAIIEALEDLEDELEDLEDKLNINEPEN